MKTFLQTWLAHYFPDAGPWLYITCVLGIIVATAIALHVLLHYVFLRLLGGFLAERESRFRRSLFDSGFFTRLSMIAQGFVFNLQAQMWLARGSDTLETIDLICSIWEMLFGCLTLYAFLNTIEKLSVGTEVGRRTPIRGISQSIKLIASLLLIIFSVSLLLDKSPIMLLSGLGAMTAILTLVFKDTILGFVAGIQLSANRMLQIGDWVEMPKYQADGSVLEINLTTVKVRNWDNTITTIPAYALTTDSFKNWRGMQESGGRRIKRAIYLDATSIRFLGEHDLNNLSRARLLTEYLQQKIDELRAINGELGDDIEYLVNGRRLTNIGTFRVYLVAYLKSHPLIHQNMTAMVRQLQPCEKGIPLEIYAFTNTVVWVDYERIQSDIFDHIYAVLREFDLRVYQAPTGHDLSLLGREIKSTLENP